MQKLAGASVFICGAGALGSNLAVNLARMGLHKLTVIDMDRVEEQNIGTQVYSIEDVGAKKADMLRNIIYRGVAEEITVYGERLTDKNVAKLLKGATLVVDTFDNSASRALVQQHCAAGNIACLHAGVAGGYGEIIWNENYKVPDDAGLDVCDYPLARNLILMVVAVASEVLVRFVADGVKEHYSITIGDLIINRENDQ